MDLLQLGLGLLQITALHRQQGAQATDRQGFRVIRPIHAHRIGTGDLQSPLGCVQIALRSQRLTHVPAQRDQLGIPHGVTGLQQLQRLPVAGQCRRGAAIVAVQCGQVGQALGGAGGIAQYIAPQYQCLFEGGAGVVAVPQKLLAAPELGVVLGHGRRQPQAVLGGQRLHRGEVGHALARAAQHAQRTAALGHRFQLQGGRHLAGLLQQRALAVQRLQRQLVVAHTDPQPADHAFQLGQ
ncbi:hypothetical protein D3C71_1444100 [compost metagenome]